MSKDSGNPARTTLYARFTALPTFYFSANAVCAPAAGGTASVSLADSEKYGSSLTSTSETTTATFTATPNAGYGFLGWSETADGAIISTSATYEHTITSTSTSSGSPTNTTLYARFQSHPTAIVANPTSLTIHLGSNGKFTYSLTPSGAYDEVTATSGNTSVATVSKSGNTFTVTAVSAGSTNITLSASRPGSTPLITTVAVTVPEQCAVPTITVTPTVAGSTANVTLSTTTSDATIYYTTDGADPSSSSTAYDGNAFVISNGVTVKAIAVKDGYSDSEIASVTYTADKIATPTISVAASGVSFDCAVSGVSYHYTTDGTTPTTSSTLWDGSPITGLSEGATIAVIATKAGMVPSDAATQIYYPASSVSGSQVIINDYEDHTWSYYQSSADLPTGYPTNYLSSPDPRNVKITYRGGSVENASAVAISALTGEDQNEMVYYKTLEKNVPGLTGEYPYTVISNPFSKRPRTTGATGTNGFYGFAGWKIVDGGEYISEYDDDDVIPLDATIHFTGFDTGYTPNCISGEVIFEATWTAATVKTGNSAQSFTGGTYETNFWVLTGNPDNDVTVPANCTMTARYPDGTSSWNGNFTRAITAGGNNAKVEFVNMNSTGKVDASNYTFTMGRGIVNSGNGGQLSGCSRDANCNQTVKIESGKYATLRNFTSGLNAGRTCAQLMILGCDYDRAKEDNSKLTITGTMYVGQSIQLNRTSGSLYVRTYIKSGQFLTNQQISDASADYCYYYSVANTQNLGRRHLEIEGGVLKSVAGGIDDGNGANDLAFTYRMRGGKLLGSIYGAAAFAATDGIRQMIFTGGEVNGWIAGGANGVNTNQTLNQNSGVLPADTYLYIGGKTKVISTSNTDINSSPGGYVFGAGVGRQALANTSANRGGNTGSVNTSYVAVSDECEVEHDVFAGGNYGFNNVGGNIFVTGGTVHGAVFGGANRNKGVYSNITMTDGLVEGGIYGGSNATGTMSGSVTMKINGGQVGTSSVPGNIHGGGYGQPTRVSQNVDITLGVEGQTEPGVTIYGDVYGGSALGYVNGTTASNTYHTNVTLNKGIINGSLYGGGLGATGTAANVYAPVTVTVNGGSVKATSVSGSGAVYGCNNIYGAPQRAVAVVINGTDPAPNASSFALDAVYGGGNRANYTFGPPTVTVNNCDNSIEYVYGGGNAASVPSTDVQIYGGNKIGNVFGGGNGTNGAANVTGNTRVRIYGGTIDHVFGGSNSAGTIGGTINVEVSKNSTCPMHIAEVYGGGNMAASNAGSIVIACTGDEGEGIGDVYGGANAADITGDITLDIAGGSIERVFGGNNASGSISGGIVVNVDWAEPSPCGHNYLGYVYGAGNKAGYDGSPEVNIKRGTVSHDVFGGGLEAEVGGSVVVNMLGGSVLGALYGGGALANTNTAGGNTEIKLVGGTVHNVYGGGLGDSKTAALVGGNVTVTLNGSTASGATNDCVVTGNIFGCNNINGSPLGHVKVWVKRTVGWTGHDVSAGKADDSIAKTDQVYEVAAVYGGGNMAAYEPTNASTEYTEVLIDGCDLTSIGYVYGGGNAASVPATEVTVEGTYEIGNVFGGGNGKDDLPNGDPNPGADVGYLAGGTPYGAGTSKVVINGGTVHKAFGGSNTLGNVRTSATVNLDEGGSCPLEIDEVYGGGNEAYMAGGGNIVLGCISYLRELYGGAKNANVGSDVSLTITSGHFDRVFGGNNIGGDINGSITVNIEETGCNPITIGELYGCGNNAAYSTPSGKSDPTVNIKSFTSIGRVFGGGLGTSATVTGNPMVKINEIVGARATTASSYAGTTRTMPDGTTVALPTHESGKIGAIGTVFGGGNAAEVRGNTNVHIGTESTISYVSGSDHAEKSVVGADIRGNVFGGGNEAAVTGNTDVAIGK